jgi:hypothetical protein
MLGTQMDRTKLQALAAYFTERDRWFRESVTDAVRLHN